MNLTTDGAATGSVRGDVSGGLTTAGGLIISSLGAVTGTNTGTNIGGGPVPNVITFQTADAASFCVTGTWTLTPR